MQCWGNNFYGQLGNNSNTNVWTPVAVTGLPSVVTAIATGQAHTCALNTTGGVQCWGINSFGQLGNNATTQSPIPVAVTGLSSGVTAIATGSGTGSAHTCALTTAGAVECWGSSSIGQLGNGIGSSGRSFAAPVILAANVPGAPTIGTATADDTQAMITFTAPVSNGGGAITGYTVTSLPAGGVDSNAGSLTTSHIVTGLVNGTAYSFTVTATNGVGTGVASAASNSVTPYVPYSVTYSGNGSTGGSVPVDGATYLTGATITVMGNSGALVKAGSTFAGWNTAANGSGTSQAAASTFAMPGANVTPYAQWTLIPTYSVTYSGNGSTGGTVPVDAATYANGATVTVPGNSGALVKAGSTFAGWNTAANGSGTSQAAASTFAMPGANVTLYAQWTLIPTYSVTYSGNGSTGGTVPVDAATYANGATVTVTGNSGALVKTGYTFAGWNTAADGSGTARAAASNFAMGSAAVTLYAQWTVTPTVPGAPTNVVAIAGAGKVSVSFTAPANSATSAIASYTVTCTASGKPTRTATGTASPVVVRGMLGGVSYSCSVVANNSGGSGVAASALPVTPTRGNNIVPVLQLLLF